ncbi:trypsin-like [Homalodisca vitripennis]|uniref:trypsin-like n=1 Tax=Homalodisca vitripennis TaxID=197043 RepID=UPI001EE9F29B|nr:trypsin-like [Homalodisca vitripennis]
MRVMCISVASVCLLALLQRFAIGASVTRDLEQDVPRARNSASESFSNDTKTCNCVCGQYGRDMRIVGGTEADAQEFPWIVLLSNRGKFYCGGTLITAKHVLTAAHCTQQIRKEHVTVTIGEHNRNNSTEKLQTRKVVRMTPHKGFTMLTFDNDIAILELDSPVTLYKTSVRTACLPNSDDEDYTGRSATVAGWGRLAERKKKTSELLRKVEVPILSESECKSKGYPDSKITENMICAGYTDGKKDACQGDSGGPLHAMDAKNVTEVIGIVSWGRGCARPNFPGIYTRVARYISWIDERLGGECRCTRRPGNRTRTPRDDLEDESQDSFKIL